MKQNPCAVVREVSESACIGFDQLDGTVESFRAGVTDPVLAVAEQPLLVATKHLDHLLYLLQATSHCVARPSFEEISGRALVPVAPKVTEVLLDDPGSTGFQVELIQGPKRHRLSATSIRILSLPCPFAARPRGCQC